MTALQIVGGLVLLILGGDWLVRGASRIAVAMRLSPLVIGLTVVAFGTSAPELAVSIQAALAGNAGVSIGNVVGSNIVNLLVVLGSASLISPLIVTGQLARFDLPILIAASLGLGIAAMDGRLSLIEGIVMFAALIAYLVYSIRKCRRDHPDEATCEIPGVANADPINGEPADAGTTEPIRWRRSLPFQAVLLLVGLATLSFGADLLVTGATTVARALGVSDLVIGLTVVAIGTSLPEVVTSLVAAAKGERDLAVGNVVGSNLFNILCVLGLTATVSGATGSPIEVAPSAIGFDIPIMIAITLICWPLFWTGGLITRPEGMLMLVYYGLYNAVMIGRSIDAPWLPALQTIALVIVVISLVAIGESVRRFVRR